MLRGIFFGIVIVATLITTPLQAGKKHKVETPPVDQERQVNPPLQPKKQLKNPELSAYLSYWKSFQKPAYARKSSEYATTDAGSAALIIPRFYWREHSFAKWFRPGPHFYVLTENGLHQYERSEV